MPAPSPPSENLLAPPGGGQLGERISVAAARLIRTAILDGRLEPSQPLREGELAERLGISRTPVREALLLLETEGLVEIVPNRGATVVSYDADDLGDIYTLRAVLEGHAARSAAERIGADALRELELSCERYASLASHEEALTELADENLAFHRIIHEAAGSRRLPEMIRQVTAVPVIYQAYKTYSLDERMRTVEQHRAIAQALEQHDGQAAARLLIEHIHGSRDLALAHLRELGAS
jgi:DNA-binding GntR family transcriptional regulator